MISIESLLGMIATEAIMPEDGARESIVMKQTKPKDKLPPIRYDLELIRKGRHLYWVE